MAVKFYNRESKFQLKQKTLLKHWIKEVVTIEKKLLGEVHFVFTTDEELLKINQSFLNHNTYTDIITFDYSEAKKINGEIYISTQRVLENAQKLKVSPDDELRRVIIHGILHLCGYKDKRKDEVKKMRTREDKAITRWLKIKAKSL